MHAEPIVGPELKNGKVGGRSVGRRLQGACQGGSALAATTRARTRVADALLPAVLLKGGVAVLLEDALHLAVLQDQLRVLAVEHKPLRGGAGCVCVCEAGGVGGGGGGGARQQAVQRVGTVRSSRGARERAH